MFLAFERLGYSQKNEMIGRIECRFEDDDYSSKTALIVDGHRISMEQLDNLLQTYEGWQIKLQILDPSKEF